MNDPEDDTLGWIYTFIAMICLITIMSVIVGFLEMSTYGLR